MCNNKLFLFLLITSSICSFNTVFTQENDISYFLDLLAIDLVDLINILGQQNIQATCDDILNSTRDNMCSVQLKMVCENQDFMWRMLDAFSKFPYSGMLIRSKWDYGSYDECIDLALSKNGVTLTGKHCLGGLIIPTTELNDTDLFEKAYKLSICIPNGCSANDLIEIFNITGELQIINDKSCSTKETWKEGIGVEDYAVIIFLILLVMVMVTSTMYDVYLYYTNQECPNILLKAFSVFYNGKKLLQVSKSTGDQIKVIHGMRVISMMWIITGHSFNTLPMFPGINIDFLEFEWTRKSTYIASAHLAVDTFFFLSGFLLAYQYLKKESVPLKTHIKRVPSMYLHRYLRLTPAAAAAYIILTTIFIHAGNGPLYHDIVKAEQDRCLRHWWSFFLYIQNYVNYDDMCLGPTWYLSVDWQLFLISPIILIPVAVLVKRHYGSIMGQLLLLNIFFTLAPIGVKWLMKDFENFCETHSYLIDYFIGFMMGVFMREKINLKYGFNTIANVVIWVIVLFTMLISSFAYQEILILAHYQDLSNVSYLIFIRVLWCVALSWIIYSCQSGYGGFINWLLTTPMVQVLSKLTYCLYVTHLCPILYFRLISRVPPVYGEWTAISESIEFYFLSILLSIFWTLAFESPIITLEKYFMGLKK